MRAWLGMDSAFTASITAIKIEIARINHNAEQRIAAVEAHYRDLSGQVVDLQAIAGMPPEAIRKIREIVESVAVKPAAPQAPAPRQMRTSSQFRAAVAAEYPEGVPM